jgi:predicted PurR-regulated permease PerM
MSKGYGIFSTFIMFIALLITINVKGPIGFFISTLLIGCVFWKIPNILQSLKNIENEQSNIDR